MNWEKVLKVSHVRRQDAGFQREIGHVDGG